MAVIVTVSGSPGLVSRTEAVVDHLARRGRVRGHEVRPIAVRELPAEALLHGDASDPQIRDAVEAINGADAVIVGTPIFRAAYSGLLKTFLDLLPRNAFRGKGILPVATGGSLAHALVVDYALSPVLRSLQPAYVAAGRFISSDHVQLHDGGGALLAPSTLADLGAVGSDFLDWVEGRTDALVPDSGEVTSRVVPVDDPALQPLVEELKVEYGTRYARDSPNELLTEVPVTDFAAPHGAFVLLERSGVALAGGAIRRRGAGVAEVKRMWTAHHVRRQGLGRRVLEELERQALGLGYTQIYLTTGPRQPEARALYLAAGYDPLFDVDADPESIGPLPFAKVLVQHARVLAS